MKKIFIILLISLIIFIPSNVLSKELNLNIIKTMGSMEETMIDKSNTTFDNELNLPYETTMIELNYNEYIFKDWADYYSITLGSNLINTESNKYTEIEFVEKKSNRKGKFEGNTNFENINFDLLLANYLLEYSTPRDNYLVLIGYEYNNYIYNIKNGTYYDYTSDSETSIVGKINDFNKNNHIPYLGFMYNRNFNNKSLKNKFILKFSPYVKANSYQKNYYNYTIIEYENKGYLISLNDQINYSINKNLIITGSLGYKRLYGDGNGEKYYYDGPNEGQSYDLNTEFITDQYEINLGLQYRF